MRSDPRFMQSISPMRRIEIIELLNPIHRDETTVRSDGTTRGRSVSADWSSQAVNAAVFTLPAASHVQVVRGGISPTAKNISSVTTT